MIGGRFARSIRRIRSIPGGFAERSRGPERPENFVRGNVQKTKVLLQRASCTAHVLPSSFKERVRAEDICLHEGRWTVDGTVNMGLRCEMDHGIGLVTMKELMDGTSIADVHALEIVSRGA